MLCTLGDEVVRGIKEAVVLLSKALGVAEEALLSVYANSTFGVYAGLLLRGKLNKLKRAP